MTPEQKAAIKKFNKAQLAYEKAADAMVESFSYYKELISEGKFEHAKNYLRPMPNSAVKMLAFRAIIVAEEQKVSHDINSTI